MKIDNTKSSAIMSGKWVKPGSTFFNTLSREKNAAELIDEAYLIHREYHSDDKVTLSRLECKYPHHAIKNGKLVVSAPGVKAAYARARQMGVYRGKLKTHLDRHLKELGFLDKFGVHYEEVYQDMMEDNFHYIESVIDSTLGTNLVMMESELKEFDESKLQFDFRYAYDVNTGHKVKIVYDLKNIQVDYAGHAYNPEDIRSFPKLTYNPVANKEVMTTISSKGNVDHRSYGQIVKQIVDMVTGQSLDRVTTISYMASGTSDNAPITLSPDEIQQRLKSYFGNKIEIKKGEVDNIPSFKSTLLMKGKDADMKTGMAENVLKTGRGAKDHDFSTIYSRNGKLVPYYSHPSKGDIKGYLKGYIEFCADIFINDSNSEKGSILLANLINAWNNGSLSDRQEWKNAKGTKITLSLINEIIKDNVTENNKDRLAILTNVRSKLNNEALNESTNNLYIAFVIGRDVVDDINYLKETLNNVPEIFDRYYSELSNIHISTITRDVLNYIQYDSTPLNESGTLNVFYIDYRDLPSHHQLYLNTAERISKAADELRTLAESTGNFTNVTTPVKYEYICFDKCSSTLFNYPITAFILFPVYDESLYMEVYFASNLCESGKPDLIVGGDLPGIDIWYLYENSFDTMMNTIKDRSIKGQSIRIPDIIFHNNALIEVLPEICESYNLIKSSGPSYQDPIDDIETPLTESTVLEGYSIDPNYNSYNKYRITVGDQSYEFGYCRGRMYESTVLGLDAHHPCHSHDEFIRMLTNRFRNHIHDKHSPATFEKIFESAGSETLLPGIHTPSQLLAYMNNINYGWISKNGEMYKDADDGDFFKDYTLQSPFELIKSRYGVCWDQVEFERQWFIDNNYNFRTYFLVIDDNENKPSHTFLIYQENNKVYWFENSWYDQHGIHVFNSLSEAMREIIDKFNKSNHNKTNDVYLYNLPKMPAGTGCEEYYRIATDSDNLLKHITMSNINESASEDSDIVKKWFITSDDGVDNCCIQVKGYDKPMRGRSAMITLKLEDDDKWYVLCKKNTDDYGVPGGGWNKDESPKHAAIRELNEECLAKVKKVERMGTLIEYSDTVKDWVKEHVPNKNDWWYGYYSAVFVGMYDGEFKGKVKEEDRETGYEWKKVDYDLLKKFPKEYSDAINAYINTTHPFHESTDEFELLSEKSHSTLQYCYRIGFDIKTGEEVAVQFKLDPSNITGVGDPRLTKAAYKYVTDKDITDEKLKEIHDTAVEIVKQRIRKNGHIDFMTDEAIVDKIFDKNHRPYDEVQIIALFNETLSRAVADYFNDEKLGKDRINKFVKDNAISMQDPLITVEKAIKDKEVREFVLNRKPEIETYKVNTKCGKDKYKTTKLIWDKRRFNSFKYTNTLRGELPKSGRGRNIDDVTDYINNNLSNKYKAKKHITEGTHFSIDVFNPSSMSMEEMENELQTVDRANPWYESIYTDYTEIVGENLYSKYLQSLPYDLMLMEASSPHEIVPRVKLNHSSSINPDFIYTHEGSTIDTTILTSNWCVSHDIPHYVIEAEIISNDKVYHEACVVYYDGKYVTSGQIISDGIRSSSMNMILENVRGSYQKYFHTSNVSLTVHDFTNDEDQFKESTMDNLFESNLNTFIEADDNPPSLDDAPQEEQPQPKEDKNDQEELPDDNPPPVQDALPTDQQEPTSNDEEQPAEEDTPAQEEPPSVPEQTNENPSEDPLDEEMPEQPEKSETISRPKQFAQQESDKNGIRRKNLYIEFIKWCKDYNQKNAFGSNFDKDIFHVTYPFVPPEMRYFYRLADPTLCVLGGGLTFFPVIQLRKLNSQNKQIDKYLIFAATESDMRVFNTEDKRVYLATEQNGELVLRKALAETFDMYIQTMIQKGDILNAPLEPKPTSTPVENTDIPPNI